MECNKNGRDTWEWQGEECYLQDGTDLEAHKSLWNSVSQNEDDICYMFNEMTPVKACGDLAYQVSSADNMEKGTEQYRESSSQVKRRRMLQFDTEVPDVLPLSGEDISSTFLKSKERDDSFEETLTDMSQWVAGFADDASASGSGFEGLDLSYEGWLADCFNDNEMCFSPDDMTPPGASNVHVHTQEFCNTQPEYQATASEDRRIRTRQNVIFKGRKSHMKTTTKLPSSVVYPFAFVKPCGMQGAITLKDINQRILTPPQLKSKQNSEDPSAMYPTSAFSGKPVVVKTKICTEGGKGSITIMRTKG